MLGMSAFTTLDNAITEGMKANIKLKIQTHQKASIEARIMRLTKEEESAKIRINKTQRETDFLANIAREKERAQEVRIKHQLELQE